VEDGQSGFLATPGDASSLARHLVTLLSDPALRARMGRHGRARVLDQFTARRMAERTEAIYDALLA
ncbi:MAG: glycosyltransferase, partial [Deltaproteobacteria bacterium]|nr:glycosyltransferase [Deltaproteobacteria bacterium]